MAEKSGIYEPFIYLGQPLQEGKTIGQIHFPDNLEKPPHPVTSTKSGFLLCKRVPGKTSRGDNIAIIAQPV